jgi:acyl-coenzyme A thioesterase PaaI-like protein
MTSQPVRPAALPELTERLRGLTPFIDTLGIEALQLDREHALLRLPDERSSHNHMGGPHAGAIFTLGETAAAALTVECFGPWLDRFVPLAVSAEISWSKLARSAVTARAQMLRPAADVEAELAAGTRPEWGSRIVFHREQDGAECAQMTVVLTMVPRRD